jgi:hypothetical protein
VSAKELQERAGIYAGRRAVKFAAAEIFFSESFPAFGHERSVVRTLNLSKEKLRGK